MKDVWLSLAIRLVMSVLVAMYLGYAAALCWIFYTRFFTFVDGSRLSMDAPENWPLIGCIAVGIAFTLIGAASSGAVAVKFDLSRSPKTN